jgi:glutamyl-tRNA synthetase
MTKHFSLERVNKSPASFDPKKLVAFQGDVFAGLPVDVRLDRVKSFAQRAGLLDTADAEAKLRAVVEGAEDRLKMAGDILDFDYFFVDTIEYDQKAFHKRICKPADARNLLGRLRDQLAQTESFDAEAVENSVNEFCVSAGIELREIIHAIRVATTGQAGGFGMFETLAILGKQRVLSRIDGALAQAATICSDS